MTHYLVLSSSLLKTRTEHTYLLLNLVDADNHKSRVHVWGVPPSFRVPDSCQVSFTNLQENDRGQSAQFTESLFESVPEDSPLQFLIFKAYPKARWDALIEDLLVLVKDPKEKLYIDRLQKELYLKYRDKPAAKANHHAYPGGLLNHTFELLNIFLGLHDRLPFRADPSIVIIACIYHDYGKLFEYKDNQLTEEMFLLGHPFISSHFAMNDLKASGFSYERSI